MYITLVLSIMEKTSMNLWCRLDQNPQENNLLTQLLLHLAVFPILIASYSSSVEKGGSLYRNVHSKWFFLDQLKELSNYYITTDPDEPIQPKYSGFPCDVFNM